MIIRPSPQTPDEEETIDGVTKGARTRGSHSGSRNSCGRFLRGVGDSSIHLDGRRDRGAGESIEDPEANQNTDTDQDEDPEADQDADTDQDQDAHGNQDPETHR